MTGNGQQKVEHIARLHEFKQDRLIIERGCDPARRYHLCAALKSGRSCANCFEQDEAYPGDLKSMWLVGSVDLALEHHEAIWRLHEQKLTGAADFKD